MMTNIIGEFGKKRTIRISAPAENRMVRKIIREHIEKPSSLLKKRGGNSQYYVIVNVGWVYQFSLSAKIKTNCK